jgi:endo-alpha-1,4-polygalactosaminidase (GH114 family)
METGIQEQPSSSTGWGDFLKTVSDYAKETASTYQTVYAAFNPPKPQDPNTVIVQPGSSGTNYTPWLIGGGIAVVILIVLLLAFGK